MGNRLWQAKLAQEELQKTHVTAEQVNLIRLDTHYAIERAYNEIVAIINKLYPETHFLSEYTPASQNQPDTEKPLALFAGMACSLNGLSGMLNKDIGRVYDLTLQNFQQAYQKGQVAPDLKPASSAIRLLRALSHNRQLLEKMRERQGNFVSNDMLSRHFASLMANYVLKPLDQLIEAIDLFVMNHQNHADPNLGATLGRINNELNILVESFRWELIDDIGGEKFKSRLPGLASGG